LEGELLLEWLVDLGWLALHSHGPPSSAKNVEAPKIVAATLGKPPGPDLSAAPFPFGIVAPTGDNGTSFPRFISNRDGRVTNGIGW